jgi:phosphohistidine phosphatase
MRLCLVRHGPANWPSWGGVDAERPLNPAGLQLLQAAGSRLAALGLHPDLVLHSPYRRAQQTAEILAEALGVPDRRQAYDGLRPGFNAPELKKLLAAHAQRAELMLVGHAPDFAEAIRSLCGGASQFKEGAVALLKVEELDKDPAGTLLWLIPPEVWTAGQAEPPARLAGLPRHQG